MTGSGSPQLVQRAVEQRRRAATPEREAPPTNHVINNYGSMVHARDIHGGAVNSGTVGGDLVVGVTSEQMLALAAALREDAANTSDPALRQDAAAYAAEVEAAADDDSPSGGKRRQSVLDRVTTFVTLAESVFNLTQGVVRAISGA